MSLGGPNIIERDRGWLTEGTGDGGGSAKNNKISRRDLLKLAGATAGAMAYLTACGPDGDASAQATQEDGGDTESRPIGGLPCEVDGVDDMDKVIADMRIALGVDGVEGVLEQLIPFKASYEFSTGRGSVEYVALPPMTIGEKESEPQLWMRQDNGKFSRLGWVEGSIRVPDATGTGFVSQKTVIWVPSNTELKLFDEGLVPQAKGVEAGDWLMMAWPGVMILRPPKSMLDKYGQDWSVTDSCTPIEFDATRQVSPTPIPVDKPVTYGVITEIASRTAEKISINKEVGYNRIPDWKMGALKSDMCMGLEVADGHENYMMLAEAFVASYENRAWMASMGIKDVDGFMKFLESSKHIDPLTGKERTGWIPLVALDGKSTFKILQGHEIADGLFTDKNPAIVKAGGFFFNNIGFVAASKAEIDANVGGVADWIEKMEEQNGKNVLVSISSNPIEKWGLVVVDGQLVFVGINNGIPTNPKFPVEKLLGQPDPRKNAQIMSAYYELYTRVYTKFGNSKSKDGLTNVMLVTDQADVYGPQLCVAGTSGMCEGKSPSSFSGDDALFVPAE